MSDSPACSGITSEAAARAGARSSDRHCWTTRATQHNLDMQPYVLRRWMHRVGSRARHRVPDAGDDGRLPNTFLASAPRTLSFGAVLTGRDHVAARRRHCRRRWRRRGSIEIAERERGPNRAWARKSDRRTRAAPLNARQPRYQHDRTAYIDTSSTRDPASLATLARGTSRGRHRRRAAMIWALSGDAAGTDAFPNGRLDPQTHFWLDLERSGGTALPRHGALWPPDEIEGASPVGATGYRTTPPPSSTCTRPRPAAAVRDGGPRPALTNAVWTTLSSLSALPHCGNAETNADPDGATAGTPLTGDGLTRRADQRRFAASAARSTGAYDALTNILLYHVVEVTDDFS